MNLNRKAEALAKRLHSKQKYGQHPYSKHLEAVAALGEQFGLTPNAIAACWLHDTIEDCGVNYAYIKQQFNEEIAEMVYCVTDELGRNRKERKLKTYPKLAKNEQAIQVKLCDRIANLTQSIEDNHQGLLKVYSGEHQDFKEKLYNNPNEITEKLWNKLETLIKLAQNTTKQKKE